MVAGELPSLSGTKGDLVHGQIARLVGHHQSQVVKGLPSTLNSRSGPVPHQRGQLHHVAGADDAGVRAGVHGDARGSGLQTRVAARITLGMPRWRCCTKSTTLFIDERCGAMVLLPGEFRPRQPCPGLQVHQGSCACAGRDTPQW